MLQKFLFVLLLFACSLCRVDGDSNGSITSVELTFNPAIGVVGNTTTATCRAQFTVNVSGCILLYNYGFMTNEVAGGGGLDLYNNLILSPVNVSSAGEYTCTVSVMDSAVCTRMISPKSSAAVSLTVQFPSGLITSASLSLSNTSVNVGSSVSFTCTAILSLAVYGAMIVFDYGFMNNTMVAVAGSTQTNMATASPVEVLIAGNQTCAVTVTAPGVCGGGGSELACPTKISNVVPLKLQFSDGLITSVSLSLPNPIGTVGSSISLTCTAVLTVDVSGAMIVFDYGFINNTVAAVAGNNQTDTATISPVELFSADEYDCTVTVTASGVCGESVSEPACPTKTSDVVTLKVQFPDLVVTGNDPFAQVGDPVVLFCNVTNIPSETTITYQWRRADMSPISGTYLKQDILFLPRLIMSDAGVYICEVNVSESINVPYVIPQTGSANVTLTVTIPAPKVDGSGVSVNVGSLAVLTCNASNNASGTTVTYQWKRAVMSVATSPMYQVSSSVGVSDAGVYICEVTISDPANNPHVISGTGSVNVILTVTIPDPVMTGDPISGDVDSLGVLTCNVSNNPYGTSATYQWKRDGNLLATSAIYNISSVNLSDAGVYTCEANVSASVSSPYVINGTGSVNVTLTVTIPALEVTNYNISAQVDDTATLICNVSSIPPGTTITYQWGRADMSPISATYSTLQILFLPYVGVSDAGVYICEVNVRDSTNNPHVVSGTGSVNVTLTVTIPDPNVTGSNVSVIVGSPAVLTCNVSNNPSGTTVTYQWKRDGMLVATSAMYSFSSPVHVSDAGVYTCEVNISDSANNTHVIPETGSLDVTLNVTISKPAIIKSPNQLSYYPGEYVTLMCDLQDSYVDDQLEYRWSYTPETGNMTGRNNAERNLTLVPYSDDAGNYTCFVNTTNIYTKENKSDETAIEVLPISMEVQVTSNMDTVLDVAPYNNHTLNCTVSHESFSRISGKLMYSFISKGNLLHNEEKSISDPRAFITVTEVSESEDGMIPHVCNVTLIVEALGNSAVTETTVNVVGGNPPETPVLFTVIPSTTNATVRWTVPKVIYTPENYTVLYAPNGNCHFSDGDTEGLNRSTTLYTPNNQTLTDFFFEKDVEFSVELDGLSPSTNYCCVVVASNSYDSTMSKELLFRTEADVIVTAIGGVIAGVVLGLAIFLLLIVWYCLCYKKRYKKFKFGAVSRYMDSKISTEKMGAMELKLMEDDSRFQIFNYPTGEAISVKDFPDYVKKKGTEALEAEYEGLQSFDYKSHDVSSIYENRPKDRFQNIYPFDDNRVTLKCLPGDDSSDYINASFVGNYREGRAYIAAQGPLPNTVEDFWRMVWEYELPTIIMLTQLEESGKEKCACYWPENGSDTKHMDNDLELKLVTQTVSPLFVTRKFSLTKMDKGSCSPLSVTQYHFTAWPDHGVPDDKTCITTFISFVRKKHPPSGPPLLVHCSAGVGRTGTFIVMDVMLQRMKEKGTIDIQGYVNQIRTNRVKMVQTALQYVYIHEALSEYLVCGDTSFAIMNARVHMRNMGAVEDGKTGFQKQFELLEELDLLPFDPSMSDGDKYPEKNRYAYNLPYNMNRVRLRVMTNDYINASWVNGYKHRGMFLATQAPLEGTVEDFWRMVWENQSHAIVMLCLTKEGEEEDDKKQMSYQYWPVEVGGKEMFGLYEVTLKSEQASDDYIIRQLTVSKTDNSEGTTVTQYHYLKWPEGGKPKVTSSILKMAADLVKTQSSTGNKGITVMCNDGVGRTGAFICIYSQLERIKTVATADIFQCVKSCRLQRAGFVKTLDEFVFCYEVVADYNDDMSLYDNFKYVV